MVYTLVYAAFYFNSFFRLKTLDLGPIFFLQQPLKHSCSLNFTVFTFTNHLLVLSAAKVVKSHIYALAFCIL